MNVLRVLWMNEYIDKENEEINNQTWIEFYYYACLCEQLWRDRSRVKLARLLYDGTEVVSSWHDFSMTGQKSCQVGTTPVWRDRSRAKLARLQYDRAEVVPSWHDFSMTWQKSCLIGTTSAYEVVSNWHDLPKFVIFLKLTHFGKNQKK